MGGAWRNTLMSGQQAVTLFADLEDYGARPCVGGGWAVDALLGEQTRQHSDLDLWRPAGTSTRCS